MRRFGQRLPSRPMMRILHGTLLFLALALGLRSEAQPTNRTVLVLGDSIAAAYGVEPEEGFVGVLQKKVAEAKLPFTVVNLSSGNVSSARFLN